MRRIPVDTSRLQFIGTGKAAARAKYVEMSDGSRRRVADQQDANDQGVPLWVVDVLVDDDESDRAEVIGVKVASYEEPTTAKWQPVRFRGLVALGYVVRNGDRSSVAYSFTAEGIEGAGGKDNKQHQPAA